MKYVLCKGGECCPVVRSTKDRVEIGEKGNLVRLKPAEWNALVKGVKTGKLGKI